MIAIVNIADEAAIDSLREIGCIVFRSLLVDWVAVETDESNLPRILATPGVTYAYPERQGAFDVGA